MRHACQSRHGQSLPPLPANAPFGAAPCRCCLYLPAFPPRPIPAVLVSLCAMPANPATANPCCSGKPVRHACQSRHGQRLRPHPICRCCCRHSRLAAGSAASPSQQPRHGQRLQACTPSYSTAMQALHQPFPARYGKECPLPPPPAPSPFRRGSLYICRFPFGDIFGVYGAVACTACAAVRVKKKRAGALSLTWIHELVHVLF